MISVIQCYCDRKVNKSEKKKKFNVKKTTEQYIEELSIANPRLEVASVYINARTPIDHRCKIHNIIVQVTPSNALKGHGCKLCRYEKVSKSRTKTREQYVDELAKKNPTVLLTGDYLGARVKTMHHCLIHDVYWEITPSSALQGAGCELCHLERISDKLKLTNEEYQYRLSLVNPDIEACEDYINMKTPILHHCKKHDVYWDTSPASTLQGCGCELCYTEKLVVSRTKSHEEYVKDVYNVNPYIKVIEKYINAYTPISHQCLIDGYVWKPRPYNVLHGYGCPICAGNAAKTEEEYVSELQIVNPNTELIGPFVNMTTPVPHKCLKHDYVWDLRPYCGLKGNECPFCSRKKSAQTKTKSHQQYVGELKQVNPFIFPIEDYQGADIPTLHQCKIDNYIWKLRPTNALKGSGCPLCNENKGERTVRLWLEKHNINYIPQMRFEECKDIRILPFDFYLPELNKCIEYDGKQHYKSNDFFGGEDAFMVRRWHDNIKDQYCDDNNIPLLRIRYNDNIEDKLKEFLSI